MLEPFYKSIFNWSYYNGLKLEKKNVFLYICFKSNNITIYNNNTELNKYIKF